jgi:hypothetical protein
MLVTGDHRVAVGKLVARCTMLAVAIPEAQHTRPEPIHLHL